MKTVDLIPLILLELNGGDKYGLEITKNIETRSAGRIVIKQPTLYTILKKLEKSKFISSYWLDSDIGGKRHYYKLTENGKQQAQTLPNYNVVLENILASEEEEPIDQPVEEKTEQQKKSAEILFSPVEEQAEQTEQVSIMDLIAVEQKESILPTQEVFDLNNIDNTTEADINQRNTSILKSESENKQEKFANNTSVSSFASKKEALISDEYKDQLKSIYSSTNSKFDSAEVVATNPDYSNIKYVDYYDFKQNPSYIKSKRTAKLLSTRMLITCCYMLFMLIATSFSVKFASDASVYYIALICGILCLVFYPILFALNQQNWHLKWEDKPYKFNIKRSIIVSTAVFVVALIVTVVLNLTLAKLKFSAMFAGKNFANFYTPILIALAAYVDTLAGLILMRKISK